MSRGAAALGEAIREMICDKTHWKHSIKAGAVFLSAHAPAFVPPKKAIMNERRMRMMMKCKLFKEPARVREDFCALALWRMKSHASHFLTTNKKGDRMKTNFFDIASALRLARRANFSRQPS